MIDMILYGRCIFTALESRLEAEEDSLKTLKTESSGIAYVVVATVNMSVGT
jgi:hypothetical protein